MNLIKTAMLLGFMTALFMGVGFLIGGTTGMAIAFAAAIAMNMFSFWNSHKMVLRMHGAVQVDETSAPQYYGIVKQLVERAKMPMPKVYIIENPQPNAFATGRNPNNAAVAATTGLLSQLSKQEIAGVMAHELAHVLNRDTLIMTITATIAGAISMLANFAFFLGRNRNSPFGMIGVLVGVLVAPFAASIVQMAISRTREYSADKLGAQICGEPMWLASALANISGKAELIDNPSAENNPATAHMFIINPLHARKVDGLFSTHPATQNRIAALHQLDQEWQKTGAPDPSGLTQNAHRESYTGRSKTSTNYTSPNSSPDTSTTHRPSSARTRKPIKTGRTNRWGSRSGFVEEEAKSDADKPNNPPKGPPKGAPKGPWG